MKFIRILLNFFQVFFVLLSLLTALVYIFNRNYLQYLILFVGISFLIIGVNEYLKKEELKKIILKIFFGILFIIIFIFY